MTHEPFLKPPPSVVEIGEPGAFGAARIQCVLQHHGKLRFPQLRIRRQARREVDDVAAFHRLGGLARIKQVGRHERIGVVDLARMTAHETDGVRADALQFPRQFRGDLTICT